MTKKRLFLSVGVVAFIAVVAFAFRPGAKVVNLQTTTERYRVLSVRYLAGTNLTFAQDEPMAAWYRRTRKAVGLPMKGFPGDVTLRFAGVRRHAIAVLCDGAFPPNLLSQMVQEMEAECTDNAGRTIRFQDMGSVMRNDHRFWLVWSWADSELTNFQQRAYANFQPTNFYPRQLCLFRKSDHHELTRLDVSH